MVEAPDEIDLVRQLEEYRAVKAAAELLAHRQGAGSGAFGRGDGVAIPAAEPPRFAPQPPSTLAKAMNRWLARMPEKPVIVPAFRVVSLREMMARIHSALARDRRVSFDYIRASCTTRQESAVAFLAMLTLMRRHVIVVTQTELFGSIMISLAKSNSIAHPQPLALEPTGADDHRNVSV
jgi:chromatin segregation and condensation protein Rec8/ScpA/Scc1 (kleisin family)